MSIQDLKSRVSNFNIQGNMDGNSDSKICGIYAIERQHCEAMTHTRHKGEGLLHVVRLDICGLMQVTTISGSRYFITFIDEMSGRIAVTLLKYKSDALGAFETYQVQAEKEAGREIKPFRTDMGGELVNQQFLSYLWQKGVIDSISTPIPQLIMV